MNSEAGFLGKTLRRQVIGIASRRCVAHLDQALLNAALEVGVYKTKSDAKLGGHVALRARAITLHRTQQAKNDAFVLMLCV